MPASTAQPSRIPPQHLSIKGTQFVRPDGEPFRWRGITAFRLLEQLNAGRATEVEAYLTWAASQDLNVVRVLAMAKHLFELAPEPGRRHLNDLFKRAAARGVYVEIVALADTAEYPVSLEDQVREVAAAAAGHPNALLEIANEPYHPTQRKEVQDRNYLPVLLKLVPEQVPVALGAWHEPDEAAAGEFITFHFPRSVRHEGWGHVTELLSGRDMLRQFGKPVVNDEPIGAGAAFQPARRDDNPDRFRAAALLTRMIGMGATFHYEGGLQSQIPAGRELECFQAWQEAWVHLPADIERSGRFFVVGEDGSPAVRVRGHVAGAWAVQRGDEAWVLTAAERGNVAIEWAPGWREAGAATWSDSRLARAARTRS